jgi:hypothetical protein
MRHLFSVAALLALSTSAALAQSPPPTNPLRRTAPSTAAASAPDSEAAPTGRRSKAAKQAASGDYKERQKRCGGEWRGAKAANTTNGQKWPQFFSACNTRLKAAGV